MDSADRHLLRTKIRMPHSDADWIMCTSFSKSSHRMCIFLNYQYKTTRDPVQPSWICNHSCTASLTNPTKIQGDRMSLLATWAPSRTLLGMAAQTVGPPRRVRKTFRGTRPKLSSLSNPLLLLSDCELDARMMNYMATVMGTSTAAPLNA
jgi:hypothetical protein